MQLGVSNIPLEPVNITSSTDLTTAARITLNAHNVLVLSATAAWLKTGGSTVVATAGGTDCIYIPAGSFIPIHIPTTSTHISVLQATAGGISILLF